MSGRNVSAMALRPCELSSSISCQLILPGQHTLRCTPAEMPTIASATVCQARVVLRSFLLPRSSARKDWKKAFHRAPETSNTLWFQELEQIHRKPFPLCPHSHGPERSAGVSFLCVFHLRRLLRAALSASAPDQT